MSAITARSSEQAVSRILELTGKSEPSGEKPWLVLAVGLPGAGKSTFCRALAVATGAVVLESDALRAALFRTPTHGSNESRQLFEAIHAAAARLLREGVSVIIDATNLRERDRRPAYDTAEAAGAGLLVLHFHAPYRVVAERLASRERRMDPDDRSTAGVAVHTRLAETEEPISRRHWKIDTSDVAATDAALQRATETLTPRRAAVRQNTGGTIT